MRILIASGIFHPDSGGPATYLYRFLPELIARRHEIRAVAYGDAPTTGYPYPLQRVSFRGANKIPFLRWARFARAYRQHGDWADLVYINTLGLPRYFGPRRPTVMKVVGDYAWERCVGRGWLPADEDIDAFQTKRYGTAVEWYKLARAREVREVDRVIVPSEYLRQMVIGWGAPPDRVQVIYNALEADHAALALSKNDARMQLGWSPDGRYLLTAARLVPWKGIDTLIDALVEVKDMTLMVAGNGPMLGALKARAVDRGVADRARFLGKVPHEKMAIHMRAADYFVLYSGYEGLSHTILEALSAGTPVIASDRGGNPETVQDGVNGLLVKHPEPGALIEAIRRAFEGDLRDRLAANARADLDRFRWDRLVSQTVAVLEAVGQPKHI